MNPSSELPGAAPAAPLGTPGRASTVRPGVHATSSAGAAQPPEAGATAQAPDLLDSLVRCFEDVSGSIGRLVEIRKDRVKHKLRRTIVRSAVAAAFAVVAAVWLGAAALAVLRGLCAGLSALWGDRAWLGDLSGGVIALSIAFVAGALALSLDSRRERHRLQAKYERLRTAHAEDHETAPASRNGGGDPGSRGSPGDADDHGFAAGHD